MLAQLRTLAHRGNSGTLGGIVWTHALLGGLIAWIVALVARSTLVSVACGGGALGSATLYLTSALGVAVGVHATLTARALGRRADAETGDDRAALRFLATVGTWVNVLAIVVIVTETVPVVFLNPCAG